MPRRNANAYKRGPHRVRKGTRPRKFAPLTPYDHRPAKRVPGPQIHRR